jgi:hypothetical protein
MAAAALLHGQRGRSTSTAGSIDSGWTRGSIRRRALGFFTRSFTDFAAAVAPRFDDGSKEPTAVMQGAGGLGAA